MSAPRIAQYGFPSLAFPSLAIGILAAISIAACSQDGSGDSACSSQAALAKTYQVGPGKAYASLQQVVSLLAAGDVVEVYGQSAPYAGGVVFSKSGTKASPIVVRGIPANGARPVISGGTNTVQFDGSHYVLDGFDITSGSSRNVFHHADDITITNTVVHDCAGHGILGADDGSGSLTLDHVEVYACGSGTNLHPVYMTTDEVTYPGSVFRMQFCYLHNQKGGNNVKSRSERNEIYYNWIEGGFYREIELIGPEGEAAPDLKREDSDVVGNVFVKTQGSNVARIGGDGDADTSGRYRFVNNTFVLAADSPAAIQVFDRVESVELHNNVFYRLGGGAVTVFNTEDAQWVSGEVIGGSNNWVSTGTSLPATVLGTLSGSDPGFVNATQHDVHLAATSILKGKGKLPTTSPSGHPFPSPLAAAAYNPPLHAVDPAGQAVARPKSSTVALGAYEVGAQTTPTPSDAGTPVGSTQDGGGAPGTGGGSGGASGDGTGGGTGGGSSSPSGDKGGACVPH